MKKAAYSKEFFSREFVAETMKDAYLKACKWYATNVLSKAELHEVQVEFEKGQNEQQFPTITIHLFTALNEETVHEKHCKICRESHTLFYVNQQLDCNRCNAMAYRSRMEDGLRIKNEYYRELLFKTIKKG